MFLNMHYMKLKHAQKTCALGRFISSCRYLVLSTYSQALLTKDSDVYIDVANFFIIGASYQKNKRPHCIKRQSTQKSPP